MSRENKSFCLGILIALLFGVIISISGLVPRPGQHLLVLSDPFGEKNAFTVIAEADSQFVAEVTSSTAAIAASPDADNTNLVSALYAKGAWLVLDASGFIACFFPRLQQLRK